MSPRDLVYVGHMLDMAKKAIGKVNGLSHDAFETDENLRLALTHLVPCEVGGGRTRSRLTASISTVASGMDCLNMPDSPQA